MILSKSCEYGLRASFLLTAAREHDYISIREISDKLHISFHFLTKILQQLKVDGIIVSFRGPKGGVKLAKCATKIKLFDIVKAIDGDDLFKECVLGLPGCGTQKPCVLHDKWMNHRDNIREMLELTTLKELSDRSIAKDYRISLTQSLNELQNFNKK